MGWTTVDVRRISRQGRLSEVDFENGFLFFERFSEACYKSVHASGVGQSHWSKRRWTALLVNDLLPCGTLTKKVFFTLTICS